MFSFARRALLWLAATAVKAHDELAALGLDGGPQQPKEAMRRSKHPCEAAHPATEPSTGFRHATQRGGLPDHPPARYNN